MPTGPATVELDHVWVPETAISGSMDNGLAIAHTSVHENRVRQAASAYGAAEFCLEKSIIRAQNLGGG